MCIRDSRYFLRHFAELAAFEDEIAAAGTLDALERDPALFRQIKEFGYSDQQIAFLLKTDEDAVRAARARIGLVPAFGSVDTCAGEFEALTPYYYSAYADSGEAPRDSGGKKSVMVLGGGPNRIGQGIELSLIHI